MSWNLVETLPWQSPLAVAQTHVERDMALLYSGLSERFTGQHSYLLLDPLEVCEGSDWAELPALPTDGDALPLWVGYLGYGMRETPERTAPSPITLPNFRLTRYATLYAFDHATQEVKRYRALETGHSDVAGEAFSLLREKERPAQREVEGNRHKLQRPSLLHVPSPNPLPKKGEGSPAAPLYPYNSDRAPLTSNLSRAEYEQIVADTIAQIHDGQFYQANITRKFFGELSPRACPEVSRNALHLALFAKLCEVSPAPYAAYIKHSDTAILSSSPECFLTVDAHGVMTTRPIKGSARRSTDEAEDKSIRDALASSSKNHAENLMIVDLMRNDLARVAVPETVEVIEQSGLYSYRTIHHLISTIRAKKRAGVSVYEAVRACFPAGSMTGAPKLAAMRWCEQAEGLERGVYSGAIGWFGAGGTCDLSVVIRTLILQGNRFEFQVGGGIVADSTPADEWRETIAKARGILAALGLDESAIAAL